MVVSEEDTAWGRKERPFSNYCGQTRDYLLRPLINPATGVVISRYHVENSQDSEVAGGRDKVGYSSANSKTSKKSSFSLGGMKKSGVSRGNHGKK